MPVISTIPPALSDIGPNASIARTIPARLNIAIAVSDVPKIPYNSACEGSGAAEDPTENEMIIATTSAIMNGPVDCIPLIMPINVSDAYPHFAESVISLTGLYL